jgi:hypothetical protein
MGYSTSCHEKLANNENLAIWIDPFKRQNLEGPCGKNTLGQKHSEFGVLCLYIYLVHGFSERILELGCSFIEASGNFLN